MWPFDDNRQQVYQQYAQGYDTGNFNGFDSSQALGQLGQFMQGAPPQLQQNVFQQHFAQMPYEHRALFAQQMPQQYGVNPNDPASMAQGLFRLGQEQPNMLQRVFSHPILMGSAVVLTGLVAKHMIEHHEREQQYGNGGGYQPYDGSFPQGGGFQYGGGGGYQGGGYQQQEINHERREERELRRELRQEEREVEHLEEREGRHRRREDYY